MAKVIVYSTAQCPYCNLAKDLLSSKNVAFEEVRVDLDENKRQEMVRLSNRRTVPQIFINDKPIGGYDDLTQLIKSGGFDSLINS